MSGHVALHRSAFDHPLLRDAERFKAWFWLVSEAAWKPARVRIKGEMVVLERGELSFSQRFLAEKWGWSKSRVDRFIADLRDEGMIKTRSKIGATAGHNAGQGQAIISICNYAKYQDKAEPPRGNDRGAGRGNSGATAGQQRGKEEEGKKEIREEPSGSSSPLAPHRDRDWPEFPEWLPAEQWNGWLEMRKRKKDGWPTPRAVELTIGKLEEWRAKGHDPGAILDNSTTNNWTGIFEPKDQFNGRPHPSGNAKPLASLRGARPNPALDMVLQAEAELAAEAEREDSGVDRVGRLALPSG